ncbi:MAG: hypothetical protein RL115_1710 [Bacteroidota bacterium]|jgi:murein L,D-transpeptidase YafK
MKNYFVLFSVLVGSSLMAGNLYSPERSRTTKAFRWAGGPVGTISIIIDKTDYELSVYDDEGWYATYPVVFGNNKLGDKKMQGDKNTPEGSYTITNKRVHEKWSRFISINYPTEVDREKFNLRKKRGEIPANASIGGSIGIHGTWPHEDFVIDRYSNWTEGCISMKNDDVKEVYAFIKPGTSVTIRK